MDSIDTGVSTPIRKASSILSSRVKNLDREDLGKIEEIVVHVPDGRIAYAVLSFGGFMGLGGKLLAIPWSAFSQSAVDEDVFILHVDREQLIQAPGFDRDRWPDMADVRWCSGVDAWYRNSHNSSEPHSMQGQ